MFLPKQLLELRSLTPLPPAVERFLARRPQGRRFPGLHCYPRARVLGRYQELQHEGVSHLLPFARSDEGRELAVDLHSSAVCPTDLPSEIVAVDFNAFLESMKTAVAEGSRRPLVRAARAGKLRRVTHLLQRGHDINEQDLDGNTPLMAALLAWQYEAAALLLHAGADLQRTDRNGHTALMWACYRNQPELVQRALDSGADPEARTRNGEPLLLFAMTGPHPSSEKRSPGSLAIVQLLVARGADPRVLVNGRRLSEWEPSETDPAILAWLREQEG
jgi:hypothetical protein